jgi:hypothetical protein
MLSVLVVLVGLSVLLGLSEVVEDEAAAVEEAAVEAELESAVVVASTLAVVFAFAEVVFALFVLVLSSLFLKSSRSSAPVSEWHPCANKTDCSAASASEHPPPTKHCSISSNDSRSTFLPRHAVIDFEHPQVVRETSSLISFCAQFVTVAETIAAPASSARKDRIVVSETSGADRFQRWRDSQEPSQGLK